MDVLKKKGRGGVKKVKKSRSGSSGHDLSVTAELASSIKGIKMKVGRGRMTATEDADISAKATKVTK